MKQHGIALLAISASLFAGCIGAPEESIEDAAEIVEHEAALSEEADLEDGAEASATASDERVYAKLVDGRVFVQVPSGEAGPLSADEGAAIDAIAIQRAPDATADTRCDADAIAGTTSYAPGDACDWCGANVWWCAGKRKYYGTVVQKSDGLYCEGGWAQMHCC
jgi:hypothetical protein